MSNGNFRKRKGVASGSAFFGSLKNSESEASSGQAGTARRRNSSPAFPLRLGPDRRTWSFQRNGGRHYRGRRRRQRYVFQLLREQRPRPRCDGGNPDRQNQGGRIEICSRKTTIHAALHELAQQLAEEPGRSPLLARALISSFLGTQSVREIVKRTMHEGRKTIRGVVSAGQEQRRNQTQPEKGKTAMQFLQSILGTVLIWSLHESPALNTWMEDSFQHFWRSISASGGEQEP